ncbi:MAG: hypothetical protein ACJZ8W_02895 [Limisphaerales bacterium]|jgi:hypothetical protein
MKDLNHEPDFDPALEHELRKLAPAPVKERLLERMENAVTHNTASVKPAQHPARNWRLWVLPATAVAGIALMVLLAPQKPTPEAAEPVNPQASLPAVAETEEAPIELFPVRRNNEVMEAVHEGIIQVPGQAPYRKVRVQVMDSMEWIAPDGVTRVEFQVPREEHLLMPMEIR